MFLWKPLGIQALRLIGYNCILPFSEELNYDVDYRYLFSQFVSLPMKFNEKHSVH